MREKFLYKRVTLGATREQVFEAVGTGAGLTAWYVPHEFDARKGGRVRADFGAGVVADGVVLVHEPPRRVIYGGGDQAPDVILEFWTTGGEEADDAGSPGETTVLHLRQRGFPEADKALFEAGWDYHLHTLQEYLKHFAGRPATTSVALTFPPLERHEAWSRVKRGLLLDRELSVGERVEFRNELDHPIIGEVDLRMSDAIDAIGVRTDDGFLRMMADEACGVAAVRFDYSADPAPDLRERVQTELQGWLERQVGRG